MSAVLHERLVPVYDEVIRRNPGEVEFHQAVGEVLETLGPVISKHPEYAEHVVRLTPLHLEELRTRL